MSRRLPSMNALRAFEAVGRHLSFTRAAQELNVTHGALSRQVRLLEEWLGQPLFERGNRRIALTERGADYLSDVGAAFDRIAAATARQLERDERRLLQVNAMATFTLRWLIPRLSSFQLGHPGIEVRLTTSNTPLQDLREPYDVAIRGGPERIPAHVAQKFLSETRIPVCSPKLIEQRPMTHPRDLARHTILHSATLPDVWSQWLVAARIPDLKPAGSITLEHFYLTLQAALDGVGVAMGPTALVADDVRAGRLVMPFREPALPARSYFTYVPDGCADDPAVRSFCAWLRRIAEA
ncbi:transcriptional regulator GcvA [Hansschlegelia beijingensis]|uniref:LysR family glycine cleavage system transcriptional activator n=1 Tax=Hansschlegelia beijingensis TaxID=1133344 RepID=A0A7W6D3J7_9HYPH|nr:transcriptional regulator GcvA [Hansschlegelia beijingensis]MBB3973931.1 LysR family glycine cleavage system transcriptional activator [Hansschlegelia beijingensis]